MIITKGSVAARVRLHNFSSLNHVADNILLGRLVKQQAGVFGRLLPKGPTDLEFTLFGSKLRFDESRIMHVGTRGRFGLSLKKGLLASLVRTVTLEPDHVAIERSVEGVSLRVLGKESVMIARRNDFHPSFQLFCLTAEGCSAAEIGREFELRLLETADQSTYTVNVHLIAQTALNGQRNFTLRHLSQSALGPGFELQPNDTILLPLGYSGDSSSARLRLRLVFDPPLEILTGPGKRTSPLKVMVDGEENPMLFQELSPEQQVEALKRLGIDPQALLPSLDRDSIDDVADGLQAFPVVRQDAIDRAVAARLHQQAKNGELVHSLDQVDPNALASTTELAKTQIDPLIGSRADLPELLGKIEAVRQSLGRESYLDLVPPGFHPRVLDLAEYAFDAGFSLGGIELDRQFVWDIMALNWLLRFNAFPRIAVEKGYTQRLSGHSDWQQPVLAFTENGSLLEIVPVLTAVQGGPPFVNVSINRLSARRDKGSQSFRGWPLTSLALSRPIELAAQPVEGNEAGVETLSKVVFLSGSVL
ncbi:MAG: hypothetical protein JW782_00190 [Candidatus Saganbacteria bacterium]|nr:hypothetical protein [Candidatus Saganbacteria bacterium]